MTKNIKGKTFARGLRPKKPVGVSVDRKPLRLWLVRQPASASVLLLQCENPPDFTEDGAIVQWQNILCEFCCEDLELYTGFKVASGRCVPVQISIAAIGEAMLMQDLILEAA